MQGEQDHPLLVQARRLSEELLAPAAQHVDRDGLPAAHLDTLRTSGLLGASAPQAYGGSGVPISVARDIQEVLATGCCTTWFVQAQHQSPLRLLAASDGPAKERLLPELAGGRLLAGVACAHVRLFPRVSVRATADRGGWRFDGTVPWYTGWGLNDVMLLAGVDADDEVVLAFAGTDEKGLHASDPLRLVAVSSSRTVSLRLDGLWVPHKSVILRVPAARWASTDLARASNVSPAVFGVAEAALRVLEETGADAATTARGLRTELATVRRCAYGLADHASPEPDVPERTALRLRALDLLRSITTAAVVAGGGRTTDLDHPAQRLARESLFLLVQGQTAPVRRAHLASLDPRSGQASSS
ncbi:acyl-CoA dehydrogenase family protein [Streptomyces griseus]|uniref:acyl-CoA dehydrogenase family protein n=1 Tax=Streptomyces griseus TaxID=1911 RepID=UPI0004C630E0|nr:acyl-CoA dehydrogenase family protein [Streptomyces griseus]